MLEIILAYARKINATDIHLKAGSAPTFRRDGTLVAMREGKTMSAEEVQTIAFSLMAPHQKICFEEERQVDFAIQKDVGRFRVSAYSQQGEVALALRLIPSDVPTISELKLPEIVSKLSLLERGLVIVSGATGSGKTTTLAAMIDHINKHRSCHIVTIEDPIEYVHKDRRSLISQREIGLDCLSFTQALSGTLRQDPDVIMIGEIQNRETLEIMMSAAETGHIVFGTLHSANALEAISRIISTFSEERKKEVRLLLSQILSGIICQRLLPRADGKGMVMAAEILINSSRVSAAIRDPEKSQQIVEALRTGSESYGMQSFDQALLKLYEEKLITYEEALRQASSPDDFALLLRGVSSGSFASI